jgi:hypothetical protein
LREATATKQSRLFALRLDCFASLAMTRCVPRFDKKTIARGLSTAREVEGLALAPLRRRIAAPDEVTQTPTSII